MSKSIKEIGKKDKEGNALDNGCNTSLLKHTSFFSPGEPGRRKRNRRGSMESQEQDDLGCEIVRKSSISW